MLPWPTGCACAKVGTHLAPRKEETRSSGTRGLLGRPTVYLCQVRSQEKRKKGWREKEPIRESLKTCSTSSELVDQQILETGDKEGERFPSKKSPIYARRRFPSSKRRGLRQSRALGKRRTRLNPARGRTSLDFTGAQILSKESGESRRISIY